MIYNPEKHSSLLSCPLFSGMDAAGINRALSILCASETDYKKGDLLHLSGTPMTRFGLVTSGAVQACEDDIEGNRIIMTAVTPGRTFGESLEFLHVQSSPVYITAVQDASVIWMTSEGLFSGTADQFTAGLQKRFVQILAQRTLSMNSRIQVLSKLRMREKLITYFSQLAAASGTKTVMLTMNRDDLAVYMGTNRSALSRELSLMKKEGIIDYSGNTFKILK